MLFAKAKYSEDFTVHSVGMGGYSRAAFTNPRQSGNTLAQAVDGSQ